MQSAVKNGDAVPIRGGSQGTPGCSIVYIRALDSNGNEIIGSNYSGFVYDPVTGFMSGSFVMGPNDTGSVRLRVVLSNIDGQSEPEASTSNSLLVNNVAPTNCSVVINQGAPTTTGRAVTLTLVATGAHEYYVVGRHLEEMPGNPGVYWMVGDVEDEPGVTNTWLPYRTWAAVNLSTEGLYGPQQGIKKVQVRYRSNSWKEADEVFSEILLEIPENFPMALPFGIVKSITRRANGFAWGDYWLNNMVVDPPGPGYVPPETPYRMASTPGQFIPGYPALNHLSEIADNPFGSCHIAVRRLVEIDQLWIWGKRYDKAFTGAPADTEVKKLYTGGHIRSVTSGGGGNTQFNNQDSGFRAFVDEYSILRRWGHSAYGQLGNGSYTDDCWQYPGPGDTYTCSAVFAGLKSLWAIKGPDKQLFATGDNTGWILGLVPGEEQDGDNVDDLRLAQVDEVAVRLADRTDKNAAWLAAQSDYIAATDLLHPGNVRYENAILNEIYWRDFYSNWKSWYRIDQYDPVIWDNYALALANWPPAKAEVADSASDLRDLYLAITVNDSTDNFISVNADYISKSEVAAEAKQEYLYQVRLPGTPAQIQAAENAWNASLALLNASNSTRIDTYTSLSDNPLLIIWQSKYDAYVIAVGAERAARREYSYRHVIWLADSSDPVKAAARDQAEADWIATQIPLDTARTQMTDAADDLPVITRAYVVTNQEYTDSQREYTYAVASVAETDAVLLGMTTPRLPITNEFTEVGGLGWKSIHACNGYTLGLKVDGSLWYWGGVLFGFERFTATEQWWPPAQPWRLSDRRVITPRQIDIPGVSWEKIIVSPNGVVLIDSANKIYEAFGNYSNYYTWGLKELNVPILGSPWIDAYRWRSTTKIDPINGNQPIANYILLNALGELYLNQWNNTFSEYRTTKIINNKLFQALHISNQCFFGIQKFTEG